ncbi:M1 family metallopeptidase [Solitalea canadensis]|uniref:Aminopeptidase N n=1 Tax=Solitalea canadensis (strain ATCC 29591 / DSM 3403 / JCM 21819 / LMG 8368 / NBRC 15130 / NCIMB 12057 / USAM 9D) TaxID=929556 RepID=H8KXG5_SOLCM|nr:M1 family metallopeptidase [Solitalea canadensis]AFD08494.1 aminopeptidase N [Solitalea canadensis DSM 3403]
MIKKHLLVTGAIFISLAACSSTKHIQLPEMVVSANSNQTLTKTDSLHKNRVYFATYTSINDLISTKLDLKFNWDSAFVLGKAQLKFKPYFYPTDSLKLSAKGFKINEVALITSGGKQSLKYDYDGKSIKVKLDKTYTRNDEYTIAVDYVAMPNKIIVKGSEAITQDKGLYFINNDGKDPEKPKQIWTQGETEANSCWFPTIDGPQEKHTQEISLTVDKKYVTLSNGLMITSKDNGDGTHTDTWKQDKMHSTYLTMIAVGDFAVVKDKWRNIEVNYYVEPKFEKYAKLVFGNTPEMIEFYSKKMGVDYAWDKYSQIVVRDFVSGAMENTSATVHFDRLNMTDREYLDETHEDIICHELFHHWFGDLVTCESWPNLPLNESFATYGEYLWYEYKYGRAEADIKSQMDMMAYVSSKDDASKDLIRFNLDDREKMFDLVSYQKGGRVLHMLRKYVGDDAFFTALKNYLNDHRFSTAEIHDLRMAFEKVTGEDLNWFFNQWFLAAGHPELSVATTYNEATKQVEINVAQLQNFDNSPLYKLPVDVDFYVDGKVERKRVVINKAAQKFTFNYDKKPLVVNFDAEKMLLGLKRETKTREEWIALYNNAPLFMDKIEALSNLEYYSSFSDVQEILRKALSDKVWGVRIFAVQSVAGLTAEAKEQFYPLMVNLAKTDSKSYVRAAALGILSQVYKSKDNKTVYTEATKDKSPMVEETARQLLNTK